MTNIFVKILIMMVVSTNILLSNEIKIDKPTYYLENSELSPKIGLNYYNPFVRTLQDKNDLSYMYGFDQLAKFKIPYIRINGGGAFYSKEWALYIKSKDEYFRRLDKLIQSAEVNNIKLIFSFFWRYSTIPELMGEKISAYGDDKSKTINFIKSYTKEIVMRYKNSPAILGWEFGNEYNLKINIPFKHLKRFFPKSNQWVNENILKLNDFNHAMYVFSKTIKEHDTKHFISSGNSIPRTYIYGKINKENYKELLTEIIRNENRYSDVVSVHLYPWTLKKRKFYQFFNYDINELLDFLVKTSRKLNKKLFIGEFSFCKIKDINIKKAYFQKYLQAFYDNNITLATMWVFNRTVDQSCNIGLSDFKILNKYNQQPRNKNYNFLLDMLDDDIDKKLNLINSEHKKFHLAPLLNLF